MQRQKCFRMSELLMSGHATLVVVSILIFVFALEKVSCFKKKKMYIMISTLESLYLLVCVIELLVVINVAEFKNHCSGVDMCLGHGKVRNVLVPL